MTQRFLSALLMTLCVALTACSSGTQTETTAPPTETTTAPTPIQLGADYTIIRADATGALATEAGIALREALGNAPDIKTDWVKRDETPVFGAREILLGATNRPESAELGAGLGLYDYKIAMMGEKLVIVGGSEDALAGAVAHLLRDGALSDGCIAPDYRYAFDGADNRDEYIADPSRFIPSWTLKFDVPDWLVDYSEKQAAWGDKDGRMMTAIHRADHKHYPENSIEAILSCIALGADSLELDVGLTRDGVPVLLHDDTLGRTTDWAQKAGQNGLPASDKLADWTLAELRQLRLKTNAGVQTDYLIPTFEEVLTVCRGRIRVRLDKLKVFNWNRDISPLIEKTDAYEVCIFNREYTLSQHRQYRALVLEHGGLPLAYQTFAPGNDWTSLLTSLKQLDLDPIAWWNGYDKKNSAASLASSKSALDGIRGQIRIYVDAQSLGGATESPDVWDSLYAAGINFILVDDALAVQQYIAEQYAPTAAQ